MASNAYYRTLARARGASLRSTLGDRYAEKQRTKTATVLDGGAVKVGSQRYQATGLSSSSVGATVAVRNIGTRANAIYAPDAGDSLAFGSAGGNSGDGGSGVGTFLELSDTFSSYSGLANRFLKVDSGPSGITAGTIADGDLPATIVRTSRTISAGTGLSGGGDLSANRSLAVNLSALFDPLYALTAPSGRLRVNLINDGGLQFLAESASIRVDHSGNVRVTHTGDVRVATYDAPGERSLGIKLPTPSGLQLDATGLSVSSSLAGNGLSMSSKVLAVGAGDGIEVSADATAVRLGSPSGLAFSGGALVVNDALAGNGLSMSSKVLSINLASPSGLVIASDALAVADSIAGDGLDIVSKVLRVDTGDGLEIFSGAVRVDEDHAFDWTARHTWGSVASIAPAFGGMFINSGNPDGSSALKVQSADVADITLWLKQKSGQTASLWRVEDVDGDALILLSNEGHLESGQPGFVSGLTGWRISATGDAEFNNIVARGEFHASTFVIDEMLVSNGTQFIGTGGRLLNDVTTTYTAATHTRVTHNGDVRVTHNGDTRIVSSATFLIDIEDPESGHAQLFQQNDILRIKNWNGENALYDNWLIVNSVVDNTDYFSYWVTLVSGTATTLPAGASVVSYGQPGDGRLLMTSDLANAPYLDIFTIGESPWAGDIAPNVRLGQLSGVGLAGGFQFGIIAGRDLSSTNLSNPYFLLSDQAARLHNLRLTLYDGARTWVDFDPDALTMTMGTDTGSAGGRLIRLDANAATMQIGNATNPAAVTVYGQIVVDDSGANTAASKDYADTVASNAADNAQSDAQSYADARRVLAVDIAFTISDADTVTWATGSLRMADGSTVSITTASNTGNMAARTYIYWRPTETELRITTNIANMLAGDVLIAIADPGAERANLTVVGGRTYISGDWINTGAITAAQIKAGSLTGDRISATTKITAGTGNDIAALDGGDAAWRIYAGHATPSSAPFRVDKTGKLYATGAVISGDITVTGGNAATNTYVDTKANTAQANAQSYALSAAQNAQFLAQDYGNARRVTGVTGTWTATDADTVTWSGVTLYLGDGSTQAITNGSTGDMPSGRNYIYWRIGESTFRRVTTPSTTVTDVLIAIAQPGAEKANIQVVGGATLISGDWINTGSVTAAQISAGAITADKINITNLATIGNADLGSVTAGQIVVTTGVNRLWLNDSGDGGLAIGGTDKVIAPFRVNSVGALTATSANISGAVTATSLNITGGSQLVASMAVSTNGALYSGTSAWATGTGWYFDHNFGTPRSYIGTKAGGGLVKGIQWDGSDISIKAQDTAAVSLLGINTGGPGLITVNMREGTGVAGYDFGIAITDGGNTSSGVSALYTGASDIAGVSAIDRIYNAYSGSGAWSDGFFATNTGGTWAGGSSAGVSFKGQHNAGGVVALFNQAGAGLGAPVVYATSVQANVGIYQATLGAGGQIPFRVDNSIGATRFTAAALGYGWIREGEVLMLREITFQNQGDIDTFRTQCNLYPGYYAIFMNGGSLKKIDYLGNISFA